MLEGETIRLERQTEAAESTQKTTPIKVKKLPRGAERMTDEAATAYWHS